MVSLKVVQACNTALVKSQPLVAVFIGATSGIGSYAAKALAKHAKDGQALRLYIVGRNKDAATRIISECQSNCPTAQFRFVQAENLALLKDVDSVCQEIVTIEELESGKRGENPRIDLLVMTQAYLAFDGRHETKEGLDELMSLLYYSRMRFVNKLMPLLLQSSLPARVVSVFGPQRDEKLFLDDISLRNPQNYGFGSMGSHAAYMKTFYMEHLAAQYSGKIALVHYYPGLVVTDAFQGPMVPGWFKYTWKLIVPLVSLFTVPQLESGERVLFLASNRFPPRDSTSIENADSLDVAESSDGIVGGGAYRVNWNGETIPIKNNYKELRATGWGEKFVAHTEQAFKDIEAGKNFLG